MSDAKANPSNKLLGTQSYRQRIKSDVAVEELIEDITRRDQFEDLCIRAVLNEDATEAGMHKIPPDNRLFQAPPLIVQQKRLAKTAAIPSILHDADYDILAGDDLLAEHMHRVALRPLNQFHVFVALREKGQGGTTDAASFFVTPLL